MNIGIVSTWLHRGAAYVTVNYARMLMPEHKVFVYARGGEYFDSSFRLEGVAVHEGMHAKTSDGIIASDLLKWIRSNSIDMMIWNEQRDMSPVCAARKAFPDLVQGSYIDYYREDTVKDFGVFDFLVCNTRRHYSVFSWHPGCFYLPWGCDTGLYRPAERPEGRPLTFFHSMGMSDRKGTDVLLRTFAAGKFAARGARLVIHTQTGLGPEAAGDGIEIIKGTVQAPGLYHMGDVYAYPAKLDGLGLTMYEALSCGLPVIATDTAPMNEVVNPSCGRLVKVAKTYSRGDGYYWPLTEADPDSLLEAMNWYADNSARIGELREAARNEALEKWNLDDRRKAMSDIVSAVRRLDTGATEKYMESFRAASSKRRRREFIDLFVPASLYHYLIKRQKSK